jgi:hypothetical protein
VLFFFLSYNPPFLSGLSYFVSLAGWLMPWLTSIRLWHAVGRHAFAEACDNSRRLSMIPYCMRDRWT